MKVLESGIGTDCLSRAQIDAYHTRGYLFLRGVFAAAEVFAWQAECDRLWAQSELLRARHPGAKLRRSVAGEVVLDRLDPVIDLSPVFRDLAGEERLLGPVRLLLQQDACLFKDKLITKPPGTEGYRMHQDYPYWEVAGVPPDDLLTVQIAIDGADRHNGAVEVFPGLHRGRLPAPAHEPRDVDETQMDTSRGELAELAPGDLLLFHSLVPHRSGTNHSAWSRRTLFFTYNAARHGDRYRTYYRRRAHAAS